MKKPVLLAALMAAALVLNSPLALAKAAKKKQPSWAARFKAADQDHSGGLSRAELKKTCQPKCFALIKKHFKDMDTDQDGQVTIAERNAFINQMKRP